ncbi:40_t:CDS:1 [Acaulospora colombiana]|uniref:40_t:CDS:1 n=1 Tax=Acaulospora colombiana TaxID=27376 RepID=A0ACA9L707_9GLOM|nr:40_t:CDS:1 [Acaulospora colombiana]
MGKTRSSKYADLKMIYEFSQEMLIKIFKELSDSDIFSCVLVNRNWCKTGMPLLWEDPLSWGAPIIETYLSFLSTEQRSSIRRTGVNIPKVTNHVFCYPDFIKKFTYTELHEATHSWLIESKNIASNYQDLFDESFDQKEADNDEKKRIIVKMMSSLICHLIKLLLNSSKGFEMVDLSTNYRCVGIPPLITKSHEMLKLVFTNLTYLKVHTNYADPKITPDRLDSANKLFTEMVEHCTKIQYLDSKDQNNERNEVRQLYRLVAVQKDLRHFTARRFELWLNLMVTLAETAANTLKTFNISGVPVDISLLAELSRCNVLEVLSFSRCVENKTEATTISTKGRGRGKKDNHAGMVGRGMLTTLSITQPTIRAKRLYFYKNKLEPKTLKAILKMLGRNLEKLTVVNNNTETIIKAIRKYCLSLKDLILQVYLDTRFSTFSEWIAGSKLRTLVLGTFISNVYNFEDRPDTLICEMLEEMGNYFPLSLKCIDFDFEISPNQLELFLTRSNYVFKELGLHQPSGLDDKYLRIIKNHTKLSKCLTELTFDRVFWITGEDANTNEMDSDSIDEEKPDRSYFSNKSLLDAEKYINTITSTSIDPFTDPLKSIFRVHDIDEMDTEGMSAEDIEKW